MKIHGGVGENCSRKNSKLGSSDQYDTVTDKEKNFPKGTADDTEYEKLWKHERLHFQEYMCVQAGFGSPTLLQRAPVLHSNLQSYISSRRTVPKKSQGSASASKSPYSTAHTSLASAHTEHQYFPSKESRRIMSQRRSGERRAGGSSRSVELCYDDYTLGHLSFSEIAGDLNSEFIALVFFQLYSMLFYSAVYRTHTVTYIAFISFCTSSVTPQWHPVSSHCHNHPHHYHNHRHHHHTNRYHRHYSYYHCYYNHLNHHHNYYCCCCYHNYQPSLWAPHCRATASILSPQGKTHPLGTDPAYSPLSC